MTAAVGELTESMLATADGRRRCSSPAGTRENAGDSKYLACRRPVLLPADFDLTDKRRLRRASESAGQLVLHGKEKRLSAGIGVRRLGSTMAREERLQRPQPSPPRLSSVFETSSCSPYSTEKGSGAMGFLESVKIGKISEA
jgi:hypothetical protein